MMLSALLQAYTRTTAPFTQPAIGASVVVDVVGCGFMALSLPVFVEGGGAYHVVERIADDKVRLSNAGFFGNAAEGVVLATGKLICPGGG